MAKSRLTAQSFEELASYLISIQEDVQDHCSWLHAQAAARFDPETKQNTADTLDRCLTLMLRDLSQAKVDLLTIQRQLKSEAYHRQLVGKGK